MFINNTLTLIKIYKNIGKGDTIEKIDAGTETECHFLKPEYMKEKKMQKCQEFGIAFCLSTHNTTGTKTGTMNGLWHTTTAQELNG